MAGGLPPFAWFTGVVEDLGDPLERGRVRIRCFGYHSSSKIDIPTGSLPWATPMMPIDSASVSGIGTSATGLLPGSWVFGFFRDGASAQDPVVIGSFQSTSGWANPTEGFSDPLGKYPRDPGAPDIPSAATSAYEKSPAFIHRENQRVQNIPEAVPPKVGTVSIPESESYYTRPNWSVPATKDYTAPVYPHNHVRETAAGHVNEVDCSPGARRIAETHPSGSNRTIINDGSEITTVVGDRYTVVCESDRLYVKGAVSITVDGDVRQLVRGNYHLEVEGNYTENIKGSRQAKIGLSDQTEIGQDQGLNVAAIRNTRIGSDDVLIVGQNYDRTVTGNSSLTTAGNTADSTGGNRQFGTGENLVMATMGSLGAAVIGPVTITANGGILVHSSAGIAMGTGSGVPSIPGSGNISIAGPGNVAINASGAMTMDVAGAMTMNAAGPAALTSVGILILESTGASANLRGTLPTPNISV